MFRRGVEKSDLTDESDNEFLPWGREAQGG
jgi:hypothetical protein